MSNNSEQSCSSSPASNTTEVLVNPVSMERNPEPITSCKELHSTNQALLQPPNESPPFWVLGVEKHEGTGSRWVMIQQRASGKVSFFRSWMDYREGFGNLDDEFWLGLEKIHRLTTLQRCELLVEMADFEGNYKFARYSRFEIADEEEEYALRQLGSYSGTAGDSLRPHVGMKFSTFDNDHDHYAAWNCALTHNSGWWFDKCLTNGTNLNGLNVNTDNQHSIHWHEFGEKWHSLKCTRIMLRVIN